MTPARIAALEAVAEAATLVEATVNSGQFDTQAGADAFDAMEAALGTLRALPADPEPEPEGVDGVDVRIAVAVFRDGVGKLRWFSYGDGSYDDATLRKLCKGHFSAFLTARVPLPAVPTVAATVTLDRKPGR